MKYLIVAGLERLCTLLDAIPAYEGGRWYRYVDWGCRLGIAAWSGRLEDRWETGAWGGASS